MSGISETASAPTPDNRGPSVLDGRYEILSIGINNIIEVQLIV